MLEDVIHVNFVHTVIAKWVWNMIKIVNHVHLILNLNAIQSITPESWFSTAEILTISAGLRFAWYCSNFDS